jgi:hypothetical protein
VGQVEGFVGFVFPDHPRFFSPQSMVRELRDALAETGQRPPEDPVGLTKVVLDSLALRYASVVGTIEELTGHAVPGIHIVGGFQPPPTRHATPPWPAVAISSYRRRQPARAGRQWRFPSLAEGRRGARAVRPVRFLPRHAEVVAEASRGTVKSRRRPAGSTCPCAGGAALARLLDRQLGDAAGAEDLTPDEVTFSTATADRRGHGVQARQISRRSPYPDLWQRQAPSPGGAAQCRGRSGDRHWVPAPTTAWSWRISDPGLGQRP